MFTRRTFLSAAAGSAVMPTLSFAQSSSGAQSSPGAQPASGKVALYANVGADLTHYDVDVAKAELTKRETVTLPGGVQYAWPHASHRYLYVASSNNAPGYVREPKTDHHVTALAIDPATGAVKIHGASIPLPTRPLHISLDIPSENILVAFNNPAAVRVYRINKDFTPGEEVKQTGIDPGIFAHQVRVTPDNRHVILVTRGNEGTPTKPEDPGALKLFNYKDGLLTDEVSIAPDGGKGFGPRHLDFHPTKPWMYVSIETQNKMYTYLMEDGRPKPDIAFRAETLAEPGNIRARQAAGTVHVHPNGRFLYGANRAEQTVEYQGKKCSRAARTASSSTRSTKLPASRRPSSISKRRRSTRALSTSTRVGACWSPSTICR